MDLNLNGAINETNLAAATLYGWADGALQPVQEAGGLVKLTNILSPLGKQAAGKVSNTPIANVYSTIAKGAVPLGSQAPNVKGAHIFSEVTLMASYLDAADREIILPLQARVEFKAPFSSEITDSVAKVAILAAYGLLCKENATPVMTRVMRGVLFRGD